MTWIVEHWQLVGFLLLVVGWIIVRLTPSVKDDVFYDKMLKFIFSIYTRMLSPFKKKK